MSVGIAVLGSTGSIGTNALNVISALGRGVIKVAALSADSNIKLLASQARAHRPGAVCVADATLAEKIRTLVPRGTKVLAGADGLNKIVSMDSVDLALFAVPGSSCLLPLMAAIRNKKRIALANKEALVSAGSHVMRLARENGVRIIPIDSEHSAIFQCLEGRSGTPERIYLTATGGPLLRVPRARFDRLPRSFILDHPRWSMGKKVSVDSATMMNKGLEVIEAKWLFGVSEKNIEVVIHPEAIVHSMVEFSDGAVFAQMSRPDMRLPIQYAITYPARRGSGLKRLDPCGLKKLTFASPDERKFPCLKLAREAVRLGGTYPAALNAADEVAVKCFLDGSIVFSRIPHIIEKVMGRHGSRSASSLDAILGAERRAKEEALRLCLR
jgi:1-deoxy-D-xylulose-5-phosphate reductoisomerase